MPSGSKKRKAAANKKKKSNNSTIQQISSSDSSQQGKDDLNNNNNDGSDSGDLASPTHHNSLQLLPEDRQVSFISKPMEGSENGRDSRDVGIDDVNVVVVNSTESSSSSDDEDSELKGRNESGTLEVKEKDVVIVSSNDKVEEEAVSGSEAVKRDLLEKEGVSLDQVVVSDLANNDEEKKVVSVLEEMTQVLDVETIPIPLPVEVTRDLDVSDMGLKGNEDTFLPPSDIVGITYGGEHPKELENPPTPQNQVLLAPAPLTVQPTSWRSCCGLFDAFMGSSRNGS